MDENMVILSLAVLTASFEQNQTSNFTNIEDQICFPEFTVCNNTMTTTSSNHNTSSHTYQSEVIINCPTNHQLVITDVRMGITYNSSADCNEKPTCVIREDQITDKRLVKYVKQEMCGVNKCRSKLSYSVPSEQVLQQHCGVSIQRSYVLPSINLRYRCVKYCEPNHPNLSYHYYWHTLDKGCISDLSTQRIFWIHLILSGYEIVKAMYLQLTSGIPFEQYIKTFEPTALTQYPGYCEIVVDVNTIIMMGNTKYVSSILTAFPPTGKQVENCEQRLMLQNETMSYVICSGNSSFNLNVFTNGESKQKYWMWYENDDNTVKAAFYFFIEVMKGKVTISCDHKTCDSSSFSDFTTTVATSPIHSKINITVIVVSCSVVLVVIVIGVLITIIIMKLRCTKSPAAGVDNMNNLTKTPQNICDKKHSYYDVYDNLDEAAIGIGKETDISKPVHYNEIGDIDDKVEKCI